MDEYIEREALLNKLKERDLCLCVTEQDIKDEPAADVAPVRHGRWDSSGKYRFQKDNSVAVRCTECGCSLTVLEYRGHVWNYCPVCGAKMDLEENNA